LYRKEERIMHCRVYERGSATGMLRNCEFLKKTNVTSTRACHHLANSSTCICIALGIIVN
jgi:hypothetical protein